MVQVRPCVGCQGAWRNLALVVRFSFLDQGMGIKEYKIWKSKNPKQVFTIT